MRMDSVLRRRFCGLLLLGSCVFAAGASRAAVAPYPASLSIPAMSWDFSTLTSLRKADGSDLWPLAWAIDGNLYGAWGDGGGFNGDSNSIGRVSLGFARITGTPVAGNPASFSGDNVWGAAPEYAENPATFGGKVDDLISVDGILYGHGGLWTAANCGCTDPMHKSGDNPRQRSLVWSTDLGRTWQLAPWSTDADPGSSLQYGKDYQGAWDPEHVYFYYQRDIYSDPSRVFLRRVLKSAITADPGKPGHFEYAGGLDASGEPIWTTVEADAVAVYEDASVARGTYANAEVVYDAPLGRYLLSVQHGNLAGEIGFFEAPMPWGPWRTLAYYDDWGGLNEKAGTGNGLSFPGKWISSDGRTLWAVFSGVLNGFDSFNVVRAELSSNADNLPPVVEYVSTGKPYAVTSARVGSLAYLDRAYRLTALSAPLANNWLIRPSNDDKIVSTDAYLRIALPRSANLYVCYSGEAEQRPSWLADGSWLPTADECSLDDHASAPRIVYRKAFPAGTLTLGGNRARPASGPAGYSNYLVIVGP